MSDTPVPDASPLFAPAPFAHLRPTVVAIALAAVASLIWAAWGATLPGGRWFAVHVFTLGVMSNAILAFTAHFARTVLHAPARGGDRGRFWVFNVGIVAMLIGLPQGSPALVGVGATAAGAAVFWLYLDLRRMRKAALAPRFAFVVRAYERASSAFLHGALLGLLMGIAVVGGAWYGALRIAHLHVMILGWAGITLLATIVFFGPTVMRTKIVTGADERAVRTLRHGATALTVAVLALLGLGFEGTLATWSRVLAAIGLAGFALATTIICSDVLRAARHAQPSPHARHLAAACVWFPLVVWVDVYAVAVGSFQLLNAVGLVALLGVLAQAVLGALGYVAPMVWAPGPDDRKEVRERLEILPSLRPAAFNLGVLAVAIAAGLGTSAGDAGALLLRAGWLLVGVVTAGTLALVVAGVRNAAAAGGVLRGGRS